MTNCKYCNIQPSRYKDQIDSEQKTFHIVKCPRCHNSVYSYQSITDATRQWNKRNEVKITERG